MSNFKKFLLIILILSVFSFTAKAQISSTELYAQQWEVSRRLEENIKKDLADRRNRLDNLNKSSQNALALRDRYKELIRKIIAPHSGDLTKYKTFLQESNSGIFRLIPESSASSKGSICVGGNCVDVLVSASSYSFRQKDYSDDLVLDIRLKNENLISDGFLAQGIIVELGNIDLENVSLSSEGINFLINFKPETEILKAKNQYSEIAKGVKFDNYNYTNSVKITENKTYAMRSIAYKYDLNKLDDLIVKQGTDDIKYRALKRDKRDDSIIAFRIIRKEGDGTITVLWRRLSNQEAPKIIL